MACAPAKDIKFYNGKVCAEHPELKGLRYSSKKTCTECTKANAREWYAQHSEMEKTRKKVWRKANSEKAKAGKKRWAKQNPEAYKAAALRGSRKHHYGITECQYQAIIAAQNNCCAICGSPAGLKTLDIDHCHATGTVRALLCRGCNHLLGNAKESVETLKAAIKYLKSHNK